MNNIPSAEILTRFGLNRNDVKIYTSLFQLGRTKTGKIISLSGVTSSRVYESLRILREKGLVSFEVKNNIKYYKAELPEQLIEDASKNIDDLRQMAKEIKHFPIKKEDRNETNTYEGLHGFKQAFIQHINAIEKNEDVGVIAFNSHTVSKQKYSRLRGFFDSIDRVLFPKTKNVRMILDADLPDDLIIDRKYFRFYKKRYLPSGYFSPAAINISAREVMISVWGDKPIVFSIKNPVAVASFRKNFDFLWNLAKK